MEAYRPCCFFYFSIENIFKSPQQNWWDFLLETLHSIVNKNNFEWPMVACQTPWKGNFLRLLGSYSSSDEVTILTSDVAPSAIVVTVTVKFFENVSEACEKKYWQTFYFHLRMCLLAHARACVYVCACKCVCACVCVCVCVSFKSNQIKYLSLALHLSYLNQNLVFAYLRQHHFQETILSHFKLLPWKIFLCFCRALCYLKKKTTNKTKQKKNS
jgi:hypothetical protein